MSARYVMAGYWAGIVAIIATLLALPASDRLTGTLAWVLMAVLAAAAVALGVARNRPNRTWPWGLLGAAILVSTCGDVLYSAVQAGAARPLLAVANMAYLLMFVTSAVALLRFARAGAGGAESGLVDAATVTVVLLLLIYVTIVSPALPDLTVLADPAALAYVMGDALLLATVLRLTTRRRTPAVVLLVLGAAAALVADIGYGVRYLSGGWHDPVVTDLGWLLLYGCWGAAALHPSMVRLTEPEVLPARETTPVSGAILLLTALTAPGVLLVEALAGRVRDGVVLALASGILFALSLSRAAAAANTHRRSLIYREHHDTLTGLYNRAYFTEHVAQARQRPDPIAVLLIDLDDFKVVNDVLGHSGGDEVLVTVARRISRLLGRHDLAARFGADEFAVLVATDATAATAATLAQAISAALIEPISFGGREVRVSGCVGLAAPLEGTAGSDPLDDDPLRQAGLALQSARASGMGQWSIYQADVHGPLVERMRLRAALDRAVTDGSFELYFQPIVSLEPERVVGFEALIRWDHPTLGLVPPSDFIDLAEETGQIEAIGAWVIRGAISTAAHWYQTQPSRPYVSVNVSARQFRTPGFAQRVDRELAMAGLPPSHLMLELTESLLLREEDQVWTELATLRGTGVRLALDDFGTGYSSLSYLVRTPIDIVKIDKSFVRRLTASPRHYAIINGIVRLAQQLGLQVLAEGIEATADRDLLVRMGCRYGQGYLFAEPMTRAGADAWMSRVSGLSGTVATGEPP